MSERRRAAVEVRLSADVLAWERRGTRVRVGQHEVFVIDEGPSAADAAPVVLLHGFPESSYDFRRCVDRLAPARRAIALDFLGFGLSDKPTPFAYSIFEHADAVEVVLARLGVARAHVLAHDMGTSVATELVARRELGLLTFDLASLTLTNGSVYLEMAHLTPSQQLLRLPGLGPLFARLSTFTTFRVQVRRLFATPPPDDELRDMYDLVRRAGGVACLPMLAGYMNERIRFAARWTGPLQRLDLPTLIVWGDDDPVAVPAIGARLAREIPGARYEPLPGVGHFSPLEAPDAIARSFEGLAATCG
jgi:pimeloyl-ACP methyl ester carboxylesterase